MGKGLSMDSGLVPEPVRSEKRLKLLGDSEPEPGMQRKLLATIFHRVIPEVALAHHGDQASRVVSADPQRSPSEEQVCELARVAACEDLPRTLEYVRAIGEGGVSDEDLLIRLIAPAARVLEAQWMADLRGFTEVAIARSTLQLVVHVLGASFAPALSHRGLVVLVAAPSERYTLGIYLLEEFLRRAGWAVQVEPSMALSDLVAVVESQRVDMVGISVSATDAIEPLAHMVSAVRNASLNPDMAVMLDGPLELAEEDPDIDAICWDDPRDAVRWLERHVKSSGRIRRS